MRITRPGAGGFKVKRRIKKKLSKRIAEILPNEFSDAFVINDPDEDEPKGILCTGGGYLEGCGDYGDVITVLDAFKEMVEWQICPAYPMDGEYPGMPDCTGVKFTGMHLIQYAKQIAAHKRQPAWCLKD